MKYVLVLLALFLYSGATQAQPAPATAPPDDPKTSAKRPKLEIPPEKAQPVRVARFDTAPVIDGNLNDEIWKSASVFKDFIQIGPGDNIAPSKVTIAMMGYDAKTLYLAFHCFDDKDKIRATVTKRDNVFGEDNVRVFLDTFNDQRRAYVLGFNPYGIQQDGILTEGQGIDFNFDLVMESKGIITEDGWTLEVAIPFKSIRYEAGKDKKWGIDIWRNIDRFNDEIDAWMPMSRDIAGQLTQEGHITGMEGISTERTLEIIPSLTLRERGRRRTTDATFFNEPVGAEAGVNIKYSITPNITLDAAINPDFAQVEADSLVVTTNQRFPIFYPEKRPFFLEGVDYFTTAIQVVNTRTIADPDLALKLTGKRGRTTFGFLAASDAGPGTFSEEDRQDPDVRDRFGNIIGKNSLVAVLRVKRDIGRQSNIGVIATSYNFPQNHNQVAGVDGKFKWNDTTFMSFQLLGTTSRRFFFNPEKDFSGVNPMTGALQCLGGPCADRFNPFNDYRTGNGVGYDLVLDYTGRNFGYTAETTGRTKDFRTNVGFTRRTDTNNSIFFWRINDNPKPKNFLVTKRLQNFWSANYDFRGRMQAWNTEVAANLNFTAQTYVQVGFDVGYERLFESEFGPARRAAAPGIIARDGTFAGADSERSSYWKSVFFYGERTFNKRFYGYTFLQHQRGIFDFDFGAGVKYPRVSPGALLDQNAPLDPGPGNGINVEAGLNVKVTDDLSANLSYIRARLVRRDTGRTAFDDNIVSLRGTYQFTRFIFLRGRLDYDSISYNAQSQVLFGWTPNPGTAFYIGYNDSVNYKFNPYTGTFPGGISRNGREFFIKMSYLFRRSF
jgi:hypothetical protein